MEKLNNFLEKVLSVNFSNTIYKYTYLYNELFISLSEKEEFVLFWVSYKSNKLKINKYAWETTNNWKMLFVIFIKFEKILQKLLEELNRWLFKIWEESDFINIYDKKQLLYNDIKNKLDLSFLDDYWYRRRAHQNFNFEPEYSILDIYHSDYECSKCHWPRYSFNNFPNYNKVFDWEYFKYWDYKKSDYLYTNINDYESIAIWWWDKIEEILQNKELLSNYDLVALNKTCISVIMWDDILSIFKNNNVDPKKILYSDQNTDSPYRSVINYLKNIEIDTKKTKKWKDKLVFFGLNKDKNTYEIITFLKEKLWIDVDKVLIPNIRLSDLQDIMNNNLAVFFTWREARAQNIFKLYPINQFESKVPYGLTNYNNLLQNILIKLWREKEKYKIDNIFKNIKLDNEKLFWKAKTIWLWFIVFDFHIKQFLVDNFRWVTILAILNDMWFKINFYINKTRYVYNNDVDEFKKNNEKINFFNELTPLDKFFSKKDIQLFYSEISNDKRILSKNKATFSVRDFEYWLEWFFRSFRKLLKKAEKIDYLNKYINK